MDQYDVKQIAMLSQKVAELDRKIDFLLEKLNLQYVDRPPQSQYPEVEKLLGEGKKIAAIKVYQQNSGVGLKEAKEAVEAIHRMMY